MKRKISCIMMILLFAFAAGCSKSGPETVDKSVKKTGAETAAKNAEPRNAAVPKVEPGAPAEGADNQAGTAANETSPSPAAPGKTETEIGGTPSTPVKEFDKAEFDKLFPNSPRFASESVGPVLLRYKFTAGKTVKLNVKTETNSNVQAAGQKIDTTAVTTMKVQFTAKSVAPNGDTALEETITHMTMGQSGTGMPSVSYDSDKPDTAALPGMELINAMINKPIKLTMSTSGKIYKVDMSLIINAFDKMQSPSLTPQMKKMMKDNITQIVDQMSKQAFTTLPENPVKAGDVFETGVFSVPMPMMGKLNTTMRYRLISVSGDKTKALLQPLFDIRTESDSKGPIKMELKTSDTNGWMLFDANVGNFTKVALTTRMNISVMQGNQPASVVTVMKALYSMEQ